MLSAEQLKPFYKKYGKEKVDEALTYLNYKKAAVLPKEEKPSTPTLFVFRHGQTTDNANMLFSGWRDPNLTEKGIEDALNLAEKLKNKKIDMLFASDQQRAIKTMKLAMSKNENAKDLKINIDPRIKEKSYGFLMGKSKLEMHLEHPKKLLEYRRNYKTVVPEGESIEGVAKRVNEFLEELIPMMLEKNINVAVSCHGNSIRGIRKRFENLTEEQAAQIETPTGKDYAAYPITKNS